MPVFASPIRLIVLTGAYSNHLIPWFYLQKLVMSPSDSNAAFLKLHEQKNNHYKEFQRHFILPFGFFTYNAYQLIYINPDLPKIFTQHKKTPRAGASIKLPFIFFLALSYLVSSFPYYCQMKLCFLRYFIRFNW